MTSDTDNQDPPMVTKPKECSNAPHGKTVSLNRLFSNRPNLPDYQYSIDQQEQKTLQQSGYKNDGSLGHVVADPKDFPECTELVPIVRMRNDQNNCHGLLVTAAEVRLWETTFSYRNTGIVGYAVLGSGKCGATVRVRHIHNGGGNNKLGLHLQTSSETEYGACKKLGYVDNGSSDFYIWASTACANPSESITVPLNRLFNDNGKLADFQYSIDQQEQDTLQKSGYKSDGSLGRVVANPKDLAECAELVPIVRMRHDQNNCHGLLVTAAEVRLWETTFSYRNTGIVGYGVLDKDKCGATVRVRHIHNGGGNTKLGLHLQISSDSEYNKRKQMGYVDNGSSDFYIWEA